jgi:hypothetical protein
VIFRNPGPGVRAFTVGGTAYVVPVDGEVDIPDRYAYVIPARKIRLVAVGVAPAVVLAPEPVSEPAPVEDPTEVPSSPEVKAALADLAAAGVMLPETPKRGRRRRG